MINQSETLYIPEEIDCRTCNMCVSHCPTFKIEQVPQESPRGRVRLIDKVLTKGETLTDKEQTHLNNCTECRACEKVCPSKMRYIDLLTSAREKMPPAPVSPMVRTLLYITSHRTTLLRIFGSLRLFQKSGLQSMAEKLGLLKLTRTDKLNSVLPKLPSYKHIQEHYPAVGSKRGSVALFTGCLTNALDNPTLHASIKVVNHLGYDVYVPQQQQCCGAIHKHNQDPATAKQMSEINIEAFSMLDVEAVLFTATACGGALKQYEEAFADKLKEISDFIAGCEWPEELTLLPLNLLIDVDEPCSHQFPLGGNKAPYQILEKIPGLEVSPLPENNICCGAGGTYMLTHTELSEEIRGQKLKHIKESEADIVVTSNIGCALHLAAGVGKGDAQVVVAHPVEVLAGQLSNTVKTA